MAIMMKVPLCLLPSVAQCIIYKKLLIRKKKMLYYAEKIMLAYNKNTNQKIKMELKDAIWIVYSALKYPAPNIFHPREDEWYKAIRRKFPHFYKNYFILEIWKVFLRTFIDEDKDKTFLRRVMDGEYYIHDIIVNNLYPLKFSVEEKSIMVFRGGSKKETARGDMDSLTYGVIKEFLKKGRTASKEEIKKMVYN